MRRLAIACFSFSAAVFISNYILPMGILSYVSAVFFLLGIYFVVRPAKFLRAVRISVFALAIGFALFYIHNENTAVVAEKLAGQSMDISAKLISYPVSYDDYCRAEVRLCTEGIPKFKAIIYDNSKTIADTKPGDILSFYGRLSSAGIRYGEEYDNYYAKDIYLIVNTKTEAHVSPRKLDFTSIPQKLNHLMAEHIESIFPYDTSAFVKSLLLGDKTDLYNMPGQYNNLSRAGLSHIVAVSGMHIAYLLGFLQAIIGKGRKASIIGILTVWVFVLITGASPSAVRAGIMQSILLMASVFKRENDTVTSISFALAVILIINPFASASISLQLSFAAMAGILAYSSKFTEILSSVLPGGRGRFSHAIAATTATSVAGMLFTVPLVAVHFNLVNVLSVISNVLVLWAVSICFCGVYLACAIAFVSLKLGVVLAWLLSWLIRYILFISKIISSIPFSTVYLINGLSVAWIILSYVLIAVCVVSKMKPAQKMLVPISASLALLLAFSMATKLSYNKADAVFSAVDVGQGQSLSVISGENTIVIDCGARSSLGNAGEKTGAYLKSCGRDNIDILMLTHLHSDHANGVLSLMEMLDVDKLIMPENPNDDDGLLAEILASAERNDCEVVYISDRSQFELGNLGIKIWQPMDVGDENERGLIIQLNAGDYDMLVTGDASSSVERYLVSQEEISGVELLIAGHHGSRYSSCGDFLKYIGGETAIISTGYNTYGHPTYETLARLDAYGYNILRTDLNGNIEIRLG